MDTHNDRVATIDHLSLHIPEPRERKSTALSLTLQTADELFNNGIQLIDQVSFSRCRSFLFVNAAPMDLHGKPTQLSYDKELVAYTNAL